MAELILLKAQQIPRPGLSKKVPWGYTAKKSKIEAIYNKIDQHLSNALTSLDIVTLKALLKQMETASTASNKAFKDQVAKVTDILSDESAQCTAAKKP